MSSSTAAMEQDKGNIIRMHVMHSVYAPNQHCIASFDWDDTGCIVFRSKIEALDRGLHWYTSPKLTPFDKVYFTTEGVPVVIRGTKNSLTRGQARVQGYIDNYAKQQKQRTH